jgi:hypothetical protein
LFLAEVGGRKTLKVLDFGIAKVVTESESFTKAFEETGASLQAFTARYGSPEQFSRRYGATGPWSDVFSLALVLVEAIVGHSALEGVDAAQLFIAAADTTRRPTLRAHGIDLGDGIEAVFATALAVDPKERYPNAGEFWDALLAAVAKTGDIPTAMPNAGSSGRYVSSNPESVTRVDSEQLAEKPPSGAVAAAATELTASAPLPDAGASVASTSASSSNAWPRLAATGVLLAIGLGGLAVWRARTPTFTAQGVSANASAGSGADAGAALDVKAVRTGASGTSSASATAQQQPASSLAKSRGFAGLPARDVPAGFVAQGGAWLDRFSVLRREDSQGLPFNQAFARCVDAGKTLCSEPEWQRACDSFPEVAETQSWTESIEDGHMVVRGAGSCKERTLASESEIAGQRVGLCCDRAIAMDSTSMQKAFLASTANIVLKLETALNQRSIEGFLDLAEDHVTLNGHVRDKAGLRSLLKHSFASSRDLVIVNDLCNVSVSAKKIVTRKRRVKKTSYETTGWTAVCRQTRHRDGKALSAKSTYEFSAGSKLRAISDSETPANGE